MSGAKTIRLAIASATVLYLLVLALLIREVWPEKETPPREITLESVSPPRGKVGEPLQVVLKGSGFDSNTRVSLTLDSGNRRAVVGTFPSWGAVKDVALDGNILIVVNQARRLMSIDITEPARPRMLGSLKLPATSFSLALTGKTAWIAMRKGILAVDLSDPRNMKPLGTLDLGIGGTDISVVKKRALIAGIAKEIYNIDLTDSSRPRLVDTLKISGFSHAVASDGAFAFFSNYPLGIQIARIEEGSGMRIISTLPLQGPITDIALDRNIAYAVSGQERLYAIDIADPFQPRLLNSVPTAGGGRKLTLAGGRAYVAIGSTGLQIFDIADPRQVKLVGTVELSGGAQCIEAAAGKVYLGTAFHGVHVLDEGSIRQNEFCHVNVDGNPSEIIADGRKILITKGETIQIGELKGQRFVTQGAITVPGGDFSKATLDRGRLFIPLGKRNIAVADIRKPHPPWEVSVVETDGKVTRVAVAGNIIYALGEKPGLYIYDVGDGSRPRLLKHIKTERSAETVVRAHDLLYLGGKGEVTVFDISVPGEPREKGRLLLPWHMRELSDMWQIVVEKGMGYIADGRNGLLILDLHKPEHPRLSGALDVRDHAKKIFVSQGAVYLGTAQKGVFMIDVSVPEKPTVVAHLNGRKIALTPDRILNLIPGRLHVLPHPAELRPRPLSGNTLAVTGPSPTLPGNYTLRVFSSDRGAELHGAVEFAP